MKPIASGGRRPWSPLKTRSGQERAAELERLGPREKPINRQHRVHIYRQRLHAERKYLTDLLESEEA